ncbi:FAD/NAD(P)-binding domain-containing protein [Xylariaceae sp. FL0804]|nr:FAD/NAD(P)-binding domain-containing protein [Xylariaceae sp. FL0804]
MGSVVAAADPAIRPPQPVLDDVRRIAIIGAGPSGLAAAKYLVAEGEGAFDRVDVLEQQAQVGGVWHYHPDRDDDSGRGGAGIDGDGGALVLPTDAHGPPDSPIYEDEAGEGNGKGGGDEDEDDFELDSDEDGCSAPGSGACSRLPPPARTEKRRSSRAAPRFPSPMYDDLNTNIPHTLMRYSDLPFPEGCKIFPSRQVVQEYLVQYAQEVRHLIRFSTQVTDVQLREISAAPASSSGSDSDSSLSPGPNSGGYRRDQWDVETRDLISGAVERTTYDAVVVATGHYTTPSVPVPVPVPAASSSFRPDDDVDDADAMTTTMVGLEAFARAHPGVVSHSKFYRSPEAYRGRRVVVVGAGPSGLDIAAQIARACAPPLLLSARTPAAPEVLAHIGHGIEQVGQIVRFLPEERGVEVRGCGDSDDDSLRRITDVDAILFCTGYLYSFPFLRGLSGPGAPNEPPLITDGQRVHGVARHFLHMEHPTLVFSALPMKIIPFPLAEAQAAVFARLWSGRLPLPSRAELAQMQREDAARAPGFPLSLLLLGDDTSNTSNTTTTSSSSKGSSSKGEKAFHVFPKGEDAAYINRLHAWAAQATTARGKGKGEGEGEGEGKGKGKGKEPPLWGPEQLWQRRVYAAAKLRFEAGGRQAESLAELGFRFDADADAGADADADAGAEALEQKQQQKQQQAQAKGEEEEAAAAAAAAAATQEQLEVAG